MHGPLLERAGIVKPELGGGSLAMVCLARLDGTAQGLAPSVDTVLELDEGMAERGEFPAVSAAAVAHRAMPRFFTGAPRQLATLCQKYLAATRELSRHATLTQEFGLPLEDDIRATLDYRLKLQSVLWQRDPLFWEEQAALVYLALKRDWDETPVAAVAGIATRWLAWLRARRPDVLEMLARLDATGADLDLALQADIDEAIAQFEDGEEDPLSLTNPALPTRVAASGIDPAPPATVTELAALDAALAAAEASGDVNRLLSTDTNQLLPDDEAAGTAASPLPRRG